MSYSSSPIEHRIPILLRCCSFEHLKQIHGVLISSSLFNQPLLSSLFIRRLAELGKIADAEAILLLSSAGPPHILKWNALIRGCSQCGHHQKSLRLFDELPQRGLSPNEFTFSDVFVACQTLGELRTGKKAHCLALRSGFDSIPSVSLPLLNLYAASSELADARMVFDTLPIRSVGLWNKMMHLYARIGDAPSAEKLFDEMPERDAVSWNTMLSLYARSKEVEAAKRLFREMPERNVFSWNIMVGALFSTGDPAAARKVFDEMPERNLVSWNRMLSSYTQSGRFKQAMDLFLQMQSAGISPDGFTLVSALSACAHLGDLKTGRWIHLHLIGDLRQFAAAVGTALIEMHAKCGDINSAFRIFIMTPRKDVFCWNVMIRALASHGRAGDALQLFTSLKKEDLELNEFTFMGALFACSHGGLVEEGRRIFESMKPEFGIQPNLNHYGCLIDLLCRAGRLGEAHETVKEMPYEPDASVWGALLGGCRAGNETAMAKRVLERIREGDDDGSGVYSIMSNMYAASGLWDDAQRTKEKMRDRRIWKTAGCSTLIVSSVTCD